MDDLCPDDASVHQESLRLLAEAAEYLGRLPPNALTRDMKVKIEAHLTRPGALVHRNRLETVAKDQEWCARVAAGNAFTGFSRLTPIGLPVVQCLVIRGAVNLRSPVHDEAIKRGDLERADRFATEIGREVAGGLRIELREVHEVLDKGMLQSWPRAA
ncbi:hypothetical protein Rfer_4426 (plasmid) [Rhodoferax ferrireducens T118]|uniref:Uncharacterized protein n=1 Tax=Albidiferax ferrireducens (strain ATCC BAA-621 / DSM 15236 / T118) TaxID=338969 RepID=Q21Q33_ALBFT|nr:hypothetical protein [Rhodoferax ferrireducens]ABD72112.1 hypothetical protein Rfer_4426 [Rhodoferax ferrireducens T118]